MASNSALVELFGPEILTKDGVVATDEALGGKTNIMIYFSAHWCPPCRGYTPQLSDAYSASGKKEETVVVFVSSDQDENGFNSYYDSMSFYALPYSDRARKEALSQKYGVRGIPTLVLLDGSGNLVQANIRGQHANYL
uniref:protein-disulfide reductase n=1 Tax=Octactis speculum TaxID=3111310 RepID=A0A7S2GG69_9STRA